LHTWRGGRAKVNAYLDDYAAFINGLVSLYEASFDEPWIDAAVELADQMLVHFLDRDSGGFFYTGDDAEQLITRQKDLQDSATPSGNSMAATALVRLGKLTGRHDYLEAAVGAMQSAVGLMQKYPAAAGQMLLAVDLHVGPTYEIAILGNPKEQPVQRALANLRQRYFPNCVVAMRSEGPGGEALDPLFQGREARSPSPTVYVCENFACQAPANGVEQVIALWEKLAPLR
jgi:uncharacterized protein YyaL (SSP411 family)